MRQLYGMVVLLLGVLPVWAQSVVNPEVERQDDQACRITRVEVTDQYTVVSFEHTSEGDNSWVTLYDGIYLQSTNDDSRYPFVKAEGIPLKPQKHYYKKAGEILAFKVYFKKLQPQVRSIDVIERAGSTNYFNFYGVSLERSGGPVARKKVAGPRMVVDVTEPADAPMKALLPMYKSYIQTAMDAQMTFYQDSGRIQELARINKEYYDALVKQGFTADQALKIITANPLQPKAPVEK